MMYGKPLYCGQSHLMWTRLEDDNLVCEFCARVRQAVDTGLSATDFIRICELSASADSQSHSCMAERARGLLDEAIGIFGQEVAA
jgi:hypothetical protein